jgi:site-specific recombinase XerD
MNTAQLMVPGDDVSATLRVATAAYLARFKGQSRVHTDSDLRSFLTWCRQQGLDPLVAQRPHVELFLRWMQEVGRYKPSTVSRRLSVVAGFYRTCVIDGLLEHSPAEYVRRPLRSRTGNRMDRHCATRRLHALARFAGVSTARMHPHMLRHTFVTTMLDAGVDLRDVQIAARHADPRTTMRYDRARKNLDRHSNYVLAAYMASGT